MEFGAHWQQSISDVGRVQALYHPLLQHSLNPPSPKSFLLFRALCDFVDNRPGHGVVVMEGDVNGSRGWGWERAHPVLSHPTQVCAKYVAHNCALPSTGQPGAVGSHQAVDVSYSFAPRC